MHAVVTSSCVVTEPTSFICCKARLVTSVLSFLCLHSKYITKVVTNSEIIAVMNRKTPTMKLLEKKFLLGIFVSIIKSLSSKSKFSFL